MTDVQDYQTSLKLRARWQGYRHPSVLRGVCSPIPQVQRPKAPLQSGCSKELFACCYGQQQDHRMKRTAALERIARQWRNLDQQKIQLIAEQASSGQQSASRCQKLKSSVRRKRVGSYEPLMRQRSLKTASQRSQLSS